MFCYQNCLQENCVEALPFSPSSNGACAAPGKISETRIIITKYVLRSPEICLLFKACFCNRMNDH